MSLWKKPTITEKGIAASRANGKRSRGPATAEGRERIRDANTRHGFYSPAEGVALRALGEKPDELGSEVQTANRPRACRRAAEIAPAHPHARLMRRLQDSNFREVRRVTNLPLRIKRHERQIGVLEKDDKNRDICFPRSTRKNVG